MRTSRNIVQIAVLAPVLVVLAVLASWSVWSEIAYRALRNPEDSHILLAIPVAVWLAALRKSRLRRWTPAPSVLGPIGVVAGWACIEAGYHTSTDVLQHFGALLMVLGAITAALGHKFLLLLKPSLIALLFLFPVPGRFRQHIAIPLQHISAFVSEHLLQLFGVGVERSGILLELNGREVAVAEACNGMRMVSALGLITFAFVFSVPMRGRVRLMLILLCPLVALVVNIIRLIPTTLAYGYATPETALLVHDIGGWAVLALAIGMLWLVLVTLRWLEVPIDPYPIPKVAA
jgi:exosortase